MDKEPIDYVINIFSQAKDLKRGESKEIKCPECGNKLCISKAKLNGHIWAICETENCIKIIQ